MSLLMPETEIVSVKVRIRVSIRVRIRVGSDLMELPNKSTKANSHQRAPLRHEQGQGYS